MRSISRVHGGSVPIRWFWHTYVGDQADEITFILYNNAAGKLSFYVKFH